MAEFTSVEGAGELIANDGDGQCWENNAVIHAADRDNPITGDSVRAGASTHPIKAFLEVTMSFCFWRVIFSMW